MKNDEEKFTVERWWAKGPNFVLFALGSQLKAAQAIWPELVGYEICSPETTSQTTSPTTMAPATGEATAIGGKTPEETVTAASTSGGADEGADTGTR